MMSLCFCYLVVVVVGSPCCGSILVHVALVAFGQRHTYLRRTPIYTASCQVEYAVSHAYNKTIIASCQVEYAVRHTYNKTTLKYHCSSAKRIMDTI